jgi:hypothetical protein
MYEPNLVVTIYSICFHHKIKKRFYSKNNPASCSIVRRALVQFHANHSCLSGLSIAPAMHIIM